MKSLSLELQKTKRHVMWLVMAALLAVQCLWFIYAEGDNKDLVQGWLILLYNFPLMNSIMVPTFIAMVASRLIDIEHKGSGWKLLETMQSKFSIYFGKVIYGFCYLFCFSVFQLLMMITLGFFFGYHGSPDIWAVVLYFVQTFTISFILFLLQMIIAILFSNQAVSLCVGICGSMAGLFLMFMPWNLLKSIIPWGHFGAAMVVGMDWNEATRECTYYYASRQNHVLIFIILWLIALLYGGWVLFRNMDTEGYSFSLFSRVAGHEEIRPKKSHIRIPHLPIEYIKIKHSPIWLAFLILPAISAFVGTFNYLGNLDLLKSGWYSLWTQHSLFLCYFFMPPLIGVYASYIWRLEHNGTNWNMVMVHTSAYRLVFNKILTCASMTAITILWTTALYLFCGFACGISTPVPPELIEWLICGIIGGITVSTLQCFLSLVIRSFAIPIGIALAGGIAGLIATAKDLWYFVPYALLSVGMRANNPERELNFTTFMVWNIIFTVLFYLLSVLYLNKTDVKTQG